VRPGQFLPQIRRPKHFNWPRLQLGAQLFMRGLLKKTVLAGRFASLADPVFRSPGEFSSAMLWLTAIAYAGQIYCDFSGYTDMALGTAHAFGFKLPQNFNRPYLADSVGEFWRRWHMTLSTWLRDYLYIPAGGSRGGNWRTYRNLLFTMGIAGLWHGAGWNFVIFGLMHGIAMSLERAFPQQAWARLGAVRAVRVAATFIFWSLSLVFFRSSTLAGAGTMLARMFHASPGHTLPQPLVLVTLLIIGIVLGSQALGGFPLWRRIEARIPAPVAGVAMACLFILIQLLSTEYDAPFIYFQF
jgi:alginate O-acetyltransferase complex protein AlgI